MGVPKAAADYTQGTDWEWRLPQLLWRGMLVDSNSLDSTRKQDGPGNLDCSWHPSATILRNMFLARTTLHWSLGYIYAS
jgi:hypothetical protein